MRQTAFGNGISLILRSSAGKTPKPFLPMNVKVANRLVGVAFSLLLLHLLILGRNADAQTILAPPPEFSITPPAVVQYQAGSQMDVVTPPEIVAHPDEPPFQWGPVGLRPHAIFRFFYAAGLPVSESNQVVTTIQEFSPGLLFDIGDHWRLDYTPTWRFYSDSQFRNTLDHNVRLTGGIKYEDWFFGLSQTYSASSAPLVETGTQTDQESFLTALNASYQFNSKMSLDAAINQRITSTEQFQSSSEWSTMDWLNYQFQPGLDAGVGFCFGYVDVETGSDMTYEQLLCRMNWRATDKISFQIHGGGELRQFLTGGAKDVLNPVAGVAIQYQPLETTQLSLNLDRVVATSLVTATNAQSQLSESVDLTGRLGQRLFKKLNLDLSGGYHTVKYVAADTEVTSREDDYYTFNARLSCAFLKRGTASVFYQYSDVSSTGSGFTYSTTQLGFEIGYRF